MQTEKVIAFITNWLTEYLEKSPAKGFVVGVSGGVDSAVVSTLCARTGKPVLVLEMPIRQSSKEVQRSSSHIKWLKSTFANVEGGEISLTNIFEAFEQTVQASEFNKTNNSSEIAYANTRSRLRMVRKKKRIFLSILLFFLFKVNLYYFASINNYLVAGTGNKVEDFGVGFYTKYGDGGVDLSPIGDLLKSQVRTVAAALGVSKEIVTAAPTDGLYGDTRTDEDQIGASYDELEWAMGYVELDPSKQDQTKLSDREKTVLQIYHQRHAANLHKMVEIPVCRLPTELKQK